MWFVWEVESVEQVACKGLKPEKRSAFLQSTGLEGFEVGRV